MSTNEIASLSSFSRSARSEDAISLRSCSPSDDDSDSDSRPGEAERFCESELVEESDIWRRKEERGGRTFLVARFDFSDRFFVNSFSFFFRSLVAPAAADFSEDSTRGRERSEVSPHCRRGHLGARMSLQTGQGAQRTTHSLQLPTHPLHPPFPAASCGTQRESIARPPWPSPPVERRGPLLAQARAGQRSWREEGMQVEPEEHEQQGLSARLSVRLTAGNSEDVLLSVLLVLVETL